jgi:predicted deacylase
MDTIAIGSIKAAEPGRYKGAILSGQAPDGLPADIPVVVVKGAKPGPVLWIHACVHGNEYCGTFITHAFLRSLDPGSVNGAVVALPAVNITAFRARQRMSPYEGFNNGDMNRCFPGNSAGGFTEQAAASVFEPLMRHATHFVDFHTAFTPDTRWALYADVGDAAKGGRMMAEAFGYEHTLPTPKGTLVGSAFMAAAERGVPSYIVEAGGIGPAFTQATVDDAAERFRNLGRAIGLLDGKVTQYGPLTTFSNFAWVNAPMGGLFRPAVKCGQPITKGDLVGVFHDTRGDLRGEARAPESGVVLAIHPGPLMPQGDTLIHIGLNPARA